MIAVSGCLTGLKCRYDGASKPVDTIKKLAESGAVIVCPELLGGLCTPRAPAEIVGGDGGDVLDGKARVINSIGVDVTAEYILGAEKTLKICLENGIDRAILKANSPSCGSCGIYDGTFTRTKRPGEGVAAALLRRHGIQVRTE